MKVKLSLCFLSLFFLVFTSNVSAATGQIEGKITDSQNKPVSQSEILIIDPTMGKPIATANADTNGNYALFVPNGTYTINIIPPLNSGLSPLIKNNQIVGTNSVVNITLSNSQSTLPSKLNLFMSSQIFLLLIISIIAFVVVLFILLRKKK